MKIKQLITGLLWAVALAWGTRAQAVIFNVSLDTTALSGTYYVNFYLADNFVPENSVTITGFSFGGGLPSGVPTVSGTVSGSLGFPPVVLTDATGDADFTQAFTAGTSLSFQVDASLNDTGAYPDNFSFSIYSSFTPPLPLPVLLPTEEGDPFNSFFNLDLTGGSLPQPYNGTGPSVPITINVLSTIPEPSTVFLFVLGGSLCWRLARRRALR